jgi:hypothetical protein
MVGTLPQLGWTSSGKLSNAEDLVGQIYRKAFPPKTPVTAAGFTIHGFERDVQPEAFTRPSSRGRSRQHGEYPRAPPCERLLPEKIQINQKMVPW